MAKKTKSYGLNNPLQDVFPVPIKAERAPTINDKNYEIGQIWVNQTSGEVYALASFSTGFPTWSILGNTASDLDTLTGDTGGPVSPTSGNINILGGDGLTMAGSGNTLTINRDAQGGYPITPYVVGPVGEAGYQTIQSALDAANAAGGGTIYIQRGFYSENLTLYDHVHLKGVPPSPADDSVFLTGTHTPPATGEISISYISFRPSDADIFAAASSNTDFSLDHCKLSPRSSGGFSFNFSSSSGTYVLRDCITEASNDGLFNISSGSSEITIIDSELGGTGTTKQMTLSGGELTILNSKIQCVMNLSNVNYFFDMGSSFTNTVNLTGSSTGGFYNCSFIPSTGAAITHSSSAAVSISTATIDSSNNPAITGAGAGTMTLTGVDFLDNADLSGSLTIAAGASKTGNMALIEPGSQLQVEGGTVTDFIGQTTLVSGTVTIANTNIAATDRILLQRQSTGPGAALGELTYSIIAATSFTITSVINTPGYPVETNDQSIIDYFIVREL